MEESVPISRWKGWWLGSRDFVPERRCVEYIEPEVREVRGRERERRRPMWEEDVEYIRV